MKREEKAIIINSLAEKLQQYPHFYVTDIEALNAEQTASLRKLCNEKNVSLLVVKNTLFVKALEQTEKADADLVAVFKGSSSIMFSETGNVPAKLIKEFRKTSSKPILKAAYVEECTYIGDANLEALVNLKSRNELIADVVALLQSPAKNVISALQASSGGKISGLVKTLSERAE